MTAFLVHVCHISMEASSENTGSMVLEMGKSTRDGHNLAGQPVGTPLSLVFIMVGIRYIHVSI